MTIFWRNYFFIFDTSCLIYKLIYPFVFDVTILVHNPKLFGQSTWPQLSVSAEVILAPYLLRAFDHAPTHAEKRSGYPFAFAVVLSPHVVAPKRFHPRRFSNALFFANVCPGNVFRCRVCITSCQEIFSRMLAQMVLISSKHVDGSANVRGKVCMWVFVIFFITNFKQMYDVSGQTQFFLFLHMKRAPNRTR